jgi:hypothetical protein
MLSKGEGAKFTPATMFHADKGRGEVEFHLWESLKGQRKSSSARGVRKRPTNDGLASDG